MAQLSNEVKTFIVIALASFDTPKQIVDAVKEEFGVAVSRQQVHSYDPTRNGVKPARRWIKLFEEEREKFKKKLPPSGERLVRIRRLERMALKAESKGNMPLAAQLYEQIAKEVGRAYTNRHTVKHKGDKDQPLGFVFMPDVAPPVGAPGSKPGDGDE